MDFKKESLKLHEKAKGKIEVISRVKTKTKEDLSLAYTPGVGEVCLAIKDDVKKSYTLTRRWNLVAVITDGTAVLGLGDIGPEASMPVMEGKCILFKEFADIDAFPICIDSKDTEEIISAVKLISKSFGGINLEDIAAPKCFEIEQRLKKELDIPVFHDDQHGTAIVVLAGLINALKLKKKELKDIKAVISGAGAAAIAITKLLTKLGLNDVILVDRTGAIYEGRDNLNSEKEKIAKVTNKSLKNGSLLDVLKDTDVFIGVSAPNIMDAEMVKSMNEKPIIFALSNPTPEIMPDVAKEAGAYIVATGRSDFKNQVNNVLAFPGIFRGALDAKASDINDEMKIAAAYAIANIVKEDELNEDYIIPLPFNPLVKEEVTKAVKQAAIDSGVAKL